MQQNKEQMIRSFNYGLYGQAGTCHGMQLQGVFVEEVCFCLKRQGLCHSGLFQFVVEHCRLWLNSLTLEWQSLWQCLHRSVGAEVALKLFCSFFFVLLLLFCLILCSLYALPGAEVVWSSFPWLWRDLGSLVLGGHLVWSLSRALRWGRLLVAVHPPYDECGPAKCKHAEGVGLAIIIII